MLPLLLLSVVCPFLLPLVILFIWKKNQEQVARISQTSKKNVAFVHLDLGLGMLLFGAQLPTRFLQVVLNDLLWTLQWVYKAKDTQFVSLPPTILSTTVFQRRAHRYYCTLQAVWPSTPIDAWHTACLVARAVY
jgi:hypothetical protein